MATEITIDIGIKIRWWVKPAMLIANLGIRLLNFAVEHGVKAEVSESRFERSSYVAPDADAA